jgi:hypothetical protein
MPANYVKSIEFLELLNYLYLRACFEVFYRKKEAARSWEK